MVLCWVEVIGGGVYGGWRLVVVGVGWWMTGLVVVGGGWWMTGLVVVGGGWLMKMMVVAFVKYGSAGGDIGFKVTRQEAN